VLRRIGNEAVLDDILKIAKHEHPRVRLEVVKALNDFKNVKALPALKEFFYDSDSTVRILAITGMGAIARDNQDARLFCQDAIIETIKGKGFEKRDFREKLSFYEALASSNSRELEDYMIETLKMRSILGIGKKTETKACAAYYLGLIRSSEALPLFQELQKSPEPLLREQAVTALRRMEHA
jgi:HEAT repeat protein